ncbi:MAG: SPOR domain-containing protein [Clostridium baratii]|uniref:SPOR domain-containing protein n=1 Tax=Clostridium baratii TaxID=1561 RepID=UPI00242F7882|nr:SPOR domain-containing protein [Clostridium baratii]MBS6005455.1 SPOR domain-containing protein [Clostridium baratii]MDU1052522.1 SPOR domain-containing protein [Clostridium baratii]
MGYTRYNYRPRKKPKGNLFTIGIVVVICAIVIGMLMAKYLFKGDIPNGENSGQKTVEEQKNNENGSSSNSGGNTVENNNNSQNEASKNFVIIQCGYYGKEENAKKVLQDIPSSFNKLIIKDGDKYRIIAGIYNEEAANNMSDELAKKKIDNVKIKCGYETSKDEEAKSYEIINGFMKILNELENEQVKSVNTTEFKKWTKELGQNSNKENVDNDELKSIKEYIEKLPEELEREGAKKALEFIYGILIKHRL